MAYKEEFQHNGVCILKNHFDKMVLEQCLNDLKQFDKKEALRSGDYVLDGKSGNEHLKYFQYVNSYIRSFDRLYTSTLLNIAEDLLDQEVYFTSMGVHNKGPEGIGSETPPHQDNFYSCKNPPDFVTAYIPLLPMSDKNGGIKYALKSHKSGVHSHAASDVPAFSSGVSVEKLKEYTIISPELEVGDIVFHHGNLIHFAERNNSKHDRYAVAIGIFGVKAKEDAELREKYLENLSVNKGRNAN